jgi:hypothetical protein
MNSNEISNLLISAMERFGQSSIVYHAISDAESQASTIEVQQGEKAAILQAGQIIKDDCTNSISNSGASGTSQSGSSSSSGNASAISPTTTSNGNLNDNTNGGTNNSSGVSGNTGSPNQTPYAPPTTTTIPYIEVPDLIGKSVAQATSLLQSSNLELGNVVIGAPDPNGPCVGDNTTVDIPSGYIQHWSTRGSYNTSPGSIIDVIVCP